MFMILSMLGLWAHGSPQAWYEHSKVNLKTDFQPSLVLTSRHLTDYDNEHDWHYEVGQLIIFSHLSSHSEAGGFAHLCIITSPP